MGITYSPVVPGIKFGGGYNRFFDNNMGVGFGLEEFVPVFINIDGYQILFPQTFLLGSLDFKININYRF